MSFKSFTLRCVPILTALAFPAMAQDAGRGSPASLPLPLPPAAPMPPDVLRSQNPWNLPMTGAWKFALTRGRIEAGGVFAQGQAGKLGISASSSEGNHPPEDAFDGQNSTRWCANDDSVPQWLQADLGKVEHVTGASLTWEKAAGGYQCRIEGRVDGGKWVTLADATAEPGIGNGPVKITAVNARFIRVTVTGHASGAWASICEFQLHVECGGRDAAWQAVEQKPAASPESALDEFAAPTFNDAKWDDLPVPSNWEMYGYSAPTYGSVDNTVGQYRRWVNVPASWQGQIGRAHG